MDKRDAWDEGFRAGVASEAEEYKDIADDWWHDTQKLKARIRKLGEQVAAERLAKSLATKEARQVALQAALALRKAGMWQIAAVVFAAILIATGVYFGVKRLRQRRQAKDGEDLQFAEADDYFSAFARPRRQAKDGEEFQFTEAETAEMQAAVEAEIKGGETDEEIVEIRAGILNEWANEAERLARANNAERAAILAKWAVDSAKFYSEGVGEKERARYDGIAKRARAAATRAKARKETHETASAARQWRESLYRAGEAAE